MLKCDMWASKGSCAPPPKPPCHFPLWWKHWVYQPEQKPQEDWPSALCNKTTCDTSCATLTQKLYYFLLKCQDNFVVWVEMKLVRDSISSQTAAFFTNHSSHFPQTPCEQRVPAHPCRKKVLCAARWQCVFLLKLRYSVQLNRYRIWRWTLTLIEGYFVVGLSFYKKKV